MRWIPLISLQIPQKIMSICDEVVENCFKDRNAGPKREIDTPFRTICMYGVAKPIAVDERGGFSWNLRPDVLEGTNCFSCF